MLARTRSSQRLISGDHAQRQLGRVEHGDPGDIDDAVVGMPEGSHVRHQQDVHRQLPQAMDDGADAPLGEPGQGDQHLVDLFLADQLLQVLVLPSSGSELFSGPARSGRR